MEVALLVWFAFVMLAWPAMPAEGARFFGGICPFCRSTKPPLRVHGHYQCVDCKSVVETCCEGDS